jgi:hypothetical protein
MTDAAIITAGFQSLKASFEIGKALLKMGINAEVKDRIREMNNGILTAQESAIASQQHESALIKQVGDLEKQIAQLEAWEAEAKTYQLTDIAKYGMTGKFAYAPKEGTHPSEPPHLLCEPCFQEGHKAILQSQRLQPGACETLICYRCISVVYLSGHPDPEHFGMRAKLQSQRGKHAKS